MTAAHTFKQFYKQTYRPLVAWIRKDLLPPTLPHLLTGFKIEAIELRAAGRCQLDGKELEFQDLRVYTSEQSGV